MEKKNNHSSDRVVGMSTEEMRQAAKEAEERYGDILNREHPVSAKHPQMSIEARAAQFAPFAALTGYEKVVERSREEVELDYLERR